MIYLQDMYIQYSLFSTTFVVNVVDVVLVLFLLVVNEVYIVILLFLLVVNVRYSVLVLFQALQYIKGIVNERGGKPQTDTVDEGSGDVRMWPTTVGRFM